MCRVTPDVTVFTVRVTGRSVVITVTLAGGARSTPGQGLALPVILTGRTPSHAQALKFYGRRRGGRDGPGLAPALKPRPVRPRRTVGLVTSAPARRQLREGFCSAAASSSLAREPAVAHHVQYSIQTIHFGIRAWRHAAGHFAVTTNVLEIATIPGDASDSTSGHDHHRPTSKHIRFLNFAKI